MQNKMFKDFGWTVFKDFSNFEENIRMKTPQSMG